MFAFSRLNIPAEADVLNKALFGMTAMEWRDKHPDLKGNLRDYASINELICLSNMRASMRCSYKTAYPSGNGLSA